MEVTPQSLRDVRFREKLRGYNPEDVDEFVTKVASLVDSLQREVRDLREQLAQRPPAGQEGDGATAVSDTEETLRRTLVLAQRTADMAIQEARAEAARILDEADAERARLDAELADLRNRLVGEAHREAEEEMQRLATLRTQLLADVGALEAHAAAQREALRAYFAEQLESIERGAMTAGEPPALQTAGVEPARPEAPAAEAPATEAPAAEAPPAPAGPFDAEAGGPEAPGPADDHDPFIAELRRAITDEAPLGPRDEPVSELARPGEEVDFFRDDEEGAGRLGSRLRRRK